LLSTDDLERHDEGAEAEYQGSSEGVRLPTLVGVTILQRIAMIPTPMGPTLVDVWVLLKDGLIYDVWVRAC